MNFFIPAKQHILDAIGKKFSIVVDISDVLNVETYEKECRIPRVEEYLNKEGILIMSHKIEDNFRRIGRKDIFQTHKHQIFFIEDYVNLDNVHNSLMAYLFFLTRFKVKDIFLFGCDGYDYNEEIKEKNLIYSYFCPVEVRRDIEIAFGYIFSGLPSDTQTFDTSFESNYLHYCTEHQLIPRKIFNTNKNSFINVFPRITYSKINEELYLDKKIKHSLTKTDKNL
jgi:hypothetical protein